MNNCRCGHPADEHRSEESSHFWIRVMVYKECLHPMARIRGAIHCEKFEEQPDHGLARSSG